MKPIFKAYEHNVSDLLYEWSSEEVKIFNECVFDEYGKEKSNPDLKFLGIHEKFSNKDKVNKLYANYYIGCKWLDDKYENFIQVLPKMSDEKQIANSLQMFLECLEDPIVSLKLDKVYDIDIEKKWIKIEEKQDEITPFVFLHFLQLVKKLSQKGLKKGYVRVTENLTSKIKGKILINQTIKNNHLKNRLDKTMCNHQILTTNCLENQIIKTALMQCSRHLRVIQNNEEITKLIRQNITSFELIDTKEVFITDFSKIKHSPFYKEYQETLKLAKMIFKRFGFTLNSIIKEQTYEIPPFHINMPELFERFVEVKLNMEEINIIDGNIEQVAHFDMRPDFLAPSKKAIIDAKYKYWFHSGKNKNYNENIEYKDDYMQLSLYGRDKEIRKKIDLDNSNDEAVLIFVYPSINGEKTLDLSSAIRSDKFNNIKRIPINIPSIGE